jgi:hypothetical protein
VDSAWIPRWFYAVQGIGRALSADKRERDAFVTGLEAIARGMKKAPADRGSNLKGIHRSDRGNGRAVERFRDHERSSQAPNISSATALDRRAIV